MTNKIFWHNPYKTKLISRVITISECDIELSDTIIYSESGGQESDIATISGIPVIKSRINKFTIIYTLETIPDFKVGGYVLSEINWPRRYAIMKLHFAAEMVFILLTKSNNNMNKIGCHISQKKSRVDFNSDKSISNLLPSIQQQVQTIIDSNLKIDVGFTNQKNERRYWKIDGFKPVSCCGTHLKSTSEVGIIKLKRKNIGYGKERVNILLSSS